MIDASAFLSALIGWYERHGRDLPWRHTHDPYAIWLSEIILQQTRIAQGQAYWERFMQRFPTVQQLAEASEDEVLKLWQGLGYYSRARNLHAAARQIVAQGRFPNTLADIQRLKGVGPYTAAALASVLDGERAPVVDGNVARVFARVWELKDDFHAQGARRKLAARLQPLMDERGIRPGDFNQAMMELGALVCTPANPACATCPLAVDCAARKAGTQADYPRRRARKELPVRRTTAVVVTDGAGRVLLVENRTGGLLKGLWELPAVEPAAEQVQTFSHFRLELTALRAREAATFADPKSVPLSTSTRKVLVTCGLL